MRLVEDAQKPVPPDVKKEENQRNDAEQRVAHLGFWTDPGGRNFQKGETGREQAREAPWRNTALASERPGANHSLPHYKSLGSRTAAAVKPRQCPKRRRDKDWIREGEKKRTRSSRGWRKTTDLTEQSWITTKASINDL